MEESWEGLRRTDQKIGHLLVYWFRSQHRSLPWRRRYSPYEVWISEMMLQQTQVKTVVPYFERWLRRFPDVAAVASADERELLRMWEGLGYYGRVRHIKKAARIMVSRHGGNIPREEKDLLELPGIGPYTAAAIRSIAFNEDVPVVDGNVKRVVSRVVDLSLPVESAAAQRRIREAVRKWLPPGKSRWFNQGLMELGARICTPRRPECAECPLKDACLARERGVVLHRPVRRPRPAIEQIEVAVGILCRDGRVFIQKRPPGGLWAGMWEFPGGKLEDGETPEEALQRELHEELGVRVRILEKLDTIRHQYTRFSVRLHAYLCKLSGGTVPLRPLWAVEGRWVSVESMDKYPFPSANRRLIRLLLRKGTRLR